MSLRFDYELLDAGWARASVGTDDDPTVGLTASYLADALSDLLRAVLRIVRGEADASCMWEEEPGEYVWEFRREGAEVTVRITAVSVPPPLGDDPEDEHPIDGTVFETRASVRDVARAVMGAADAVLEKHGAEGYFEIWRYPFPESELRSLHDIVDS